MASSLKFPTIEIEDLSSYIMDAACSPNTPIAIVGPPGAGKTQIAQTVVATMSRVFAADLKAAGFDSYVYAPIELGQIPQEEVNGIPHSFIGPDGVRHVVRFPMAAVELATRPALLHLDERGRGSKAVEDAAMTGISERRFGDVKLHPLTRILITGNDWTVSGGVKAPGDAFLTRLAWFTLRVTPQGWCQWAREHAAGLADTQPERAELLADYAALVEGRPGSLFMPEPSATTEAGSVLYPNGRQIDKAMETIAPIVRQLRTERKAGPVNEGAYSSRIFNHVAARIGTEAAAQWTALRELRDKVATPAQIKADPWNAKLPPDIESAVAILSTLTSLKGLKPLECPVADAEAAWVYASRLPQAQVQAAAVRILLPVFSKVRDPKALSAANKLVAKVGNKLK